MSNHRHHEGASAQHVDEHDFATNKNGVAIQWIKHNPLANAPSESDLFADNSLFINTKIE